MPSEAIPTVSRTATGTGIWRPTTSAAIYEATLANWFGVPLASLRDLLPGLSAFSEPTLWFL
ncbi:MAG: hypothetical protein GY953_05455 [bacterium]|nr:hypothetical protein [bacterium]